MVVPEAYGFKSIKWLTHIVLTNLYHANDTYAEGNNDIESLHVQVFVRAIAPLRLFISRSKLFKIAIFHKKSRPGGELLTAGW